MRCATFILLAALALGVSANLECYQCTSNENPSCAVNEDSALTAFKKKCAPLEEGSLKGKQAIGCRKINQFVEGDQTVVRECAYSGEKVDGLKKTGNHAIQLYYYQCENESTGTPCNSVGITFPIFSIISVIVAYMMH